jgi:NADPH:quinone reductase-like Zn-dependent oxidoreductase
VYYTHIIHLELSMKAAIVVAAGQPPVYGDFQDPVPAPGKARIKVTASAISHVTKARASGTHYSSHGEFPFIPGVDGAGITDEGKRVYFMMPEKPYGAMAEFCTIDSRQQFALPDDLTEVAAAAMAVPGMSSWGALTERAKFQQGETVLVNGATGTSGRLAIQIAKHLGAGKVVATGRDVASFDELRRLGADVTISLTRDHDALETAFKHEFEQGIDVVLDYLWGASAETLIIAAAKAGPEGVPIRFVQIGSMSGSNITLPSAALRSSSLQLLGSGIGSIPPQRLFAIIQGVLTAAPKTGFKIATKPMPLADVANAWNAADSRTRIVLVP